MALFSEKESESAFTILGENTLFDGSLKFSQELAIAGNFKGKIDATGFLHIRKSAACDVDHIAAESIIVEGKVDGNLRAEGRVEMRSGCSVRGDVAASAIKIDDNVSFEGNVEMIKGKSDADIFLMRGDVLKAKLMGESELGADS